MGTTKKPDIALAPVKLTPQPIAQKRPPVSPAPASPAATETDKLPELSTSKVWVVPPRPKPGRKPSAEAPSSARKAQNRAAQRAFRERRAARVSELEDRIAQMERERDMREEKLYSALERMSKDNITLRKALSDPNDPKNPHQLQHQLHGRQSGYGHSTPAPSPASSVSSSGSGNDGYREPKIEQDAPMELLDKALETKLPVNGKRALDSGSDNSLDAAASCVVCVKDDCICESVGIKARPIASSNSVPLPRFKRLTPSTISKSNTGSKRAAAAPSVSLQKPRARDVEMEIDFTAQFSRPLKKVRAGPAAMMAEISPLSPAPVGNPVAPFEARDHSHDGCGFCSEGTPCMCAEAKEEESQRDSATGVSDSMTLAPIFPPSSHSRALGTPKKLPALQPDFNNRVVTVGAPVHSAPPTPVKETSGGCSGNPGNCAQCQLDPMSTLFCTTLASAEKQELREPEATNLGGAYIPCAAAYQTLSRHKIFKQADLGRLVGRLHTKGMQVEVSSVANVLRELDRRLYD